VKRTNIGVLVLLAAIGAIGGAFLETGLTASGRPIIIPPLTLAIALAAIGGIVISLAVPIRRLTRGKATAPIDPYYATRVLVLAKASSLTGALVTGIGVGTVFYLLSRSIVAASSVGTAIATVLGAAVLLAGGLVAEYMCSVPPSDDDDGGPAVRVRP